MSFAHGIAHPYSLITWCCLLTIIHHSSFLLITLMIFHLITICSWVAPCHCMKRAGHPWFALISFARMSSFLCWWAWTHSSMDGHSSPGEIMEPMRGWLIGDLCLIIVFPWFFIENPMNCHWKSMIFDWTFPCRTSWCLIENHFNWWCSPMGLINFLLDGWSHLLILQHLLQADVLQLQPSSHASVVPYWFNHWLIFSSFP